MSLSFERQIHLHGAHVARTPLSYASSKVFCLWRCCGFDFRECDTNDMENGSTEFLSDVSPVNAIDNDAFGNSGFEKVCLTFSNTLDFHRYMVPAMFSSFNSHCHAPVMENFRDQSSFLNMTPAGFRASLKMVS